MPQFRLLVDGIWFHNHVLNLNGRQNERLSLKKLHVCLSKLCMYPSYVNMAPTIIHCHAQVPPHWSQTSYDDMNTLKKFKKKLFQIIKLIKLKCVPCKIEISTQVWVQVDKILTWWGREEKFIKTTTLCKDF